MSILESFYLLFETNSEDVEKGTSKAKGAADKLNKSLADTKDTSNKLGSSLLNIAHQFTGALLGSLSLGGILAGIKSAADYANELHKASKTLGESVESLDVWGKAVEKNGGTAQGFVQTVKTLTQGLQQVDANGMRPAAQEFSKLGISITNSQGKLKSATELLPSLAAAFEKLSKAKSFSIGRSLGLDEATILLLQRGRREVDGIILKQKELGVVTKQDAEIAAKFNEQWEDTKHSFSSLFTLVATSVLPAFTSIANAFEKVAVFFRKHSDFIVGSLIAIGSALLYVVVPAVISTLAAFAPFIIIGGLFALIYDDIQNFLKGNASVLGDIVAKYPIVLDIINMIARGFKILKADFIAAFKGVGELLSSIGLGVTLDWQKVFEFIKAGLEAIGSAYQSVKSFIGFGDTKITGELTSAKNAMALANSTPISSISSNSILANKYNNSKTTNVQTGTITIETQSTDAKGIALDISQALDKQLSLTQANFDDGLLA